MATGVGVPAELDRNERLGGGEFQRSRETQDIRAPRLFQRFRRVMISARYD
jgi:hypothetical protein